MSLDVGQVLSNAFGVPKSDVPRTIGYMLPYVSSFTKSYDYAQEQKRWNDDFQKNVGKAIRYPMRTGHDLASLYGNIGRSTSSAVSSAYNNLSKDWSNYQKTSRSLVGFN